MVELTDGIMPGIASMANIHPMLVHFPIAFLNAFLLMELLAFALKRDDLKVVATWMLVLGTLGAAAAVTAGLWAASTVGHGSEEVHAIMKRHGDYGIAVLALALTLTTLRALYRWKLPRKLQLISLLLALVMVGTMAFGVDLGGLMVYKHGVAVAAVPQPEGHEHSGAGHAQEPAVMHDEVQLDDSQDSQGNGHDDGHSMPHEH